MKFFSLENPIWKFIGNLADFFLLSCLWYLCCLPVVTAGAATTALYYVTLKMARGQEGQLIPAFFHSFKQNLKQATALWVGYLAVGILLVLDLVICLQTSSVFAGAIFFTSVVLLACWALFITMLFPLVARCDNTIGALFKMGIAMALLGSPKLLILDEPTNGLDPAGIQEMRSLIASMPQTTGATVLISSHLLGEIEQMVDQVGILNHGKLLFEGSLQQLQKHSRGGILLRVLDAPKAAAVLQQQGVKTAAPADQPDTLQLPPLPDEALAALVCTLAESGVGVVGLTAQTKSLEDIFLSLTQTSGEVA